MDLKAMFWTAVALGLGFGVALEIVEYVSEVWRLKRQHDARARSE